MSLAIAAPSDSAAELANQTSDGSPVSEDNHPTEIPEFHTVDELLAAYHAADRDVHEKAAAAGEQEKLSREAEASFEEHKEAVYRSLEYMQRFLSQRGTDRFLRRQAQLISWKDYKKQVQKDFPLLGGERNIQHHIAALRGHKRPREKKLNAPATEQELAVTVGAPDCDYENLHKDAITKCFGGASLDAMWKLFEKHCEQMKWKPEVIVDRTPPKKETKEEKKARIEREEFERLVKSPHALIKITA